VIEQLYTPIIITQMRERTLTRSQRSSMPNLWKTTIEADQATGWHGHATWHGAPCQVFEILHRNKARTDFSTVVPLGMGASYYLALAAHAKFLQYSSLLFLP